MYSVEGTLKDLTSMPELKQLGFAEGVKHVYPVKLVDIKPEDSVSVKGKAEKTEVGESDWLLGIEDKETPFEIKVNGEPYMKLTFTNTTLAGGE